MVQLHRALKGEFHEDCQNHHHDHRRNSCRCITCSRGNTITDGAHYETRDEARSRYVTYNSYETHHCNEASPHDGASKTNGFKVISFKKVRSQGLTCNTTS